MGPPQKFLELKRQQAPEGPFDLDNLELTSVEHRGTFLVAALQLPDSSAAILEGVLNNLKTGELSRGNCTLVSSKKPGSSKPDGLKLDCTWECTFGPEHKSHHKQKAAMGPQFVPMSQKAADKAAREQTPRQQQAHVPGQEAAESLAQQPAGAGAGEGTGQQGMGVTQESEQHAPVDKAPQQQKAQQQKARTRRSKIEHGCSVKRGCLYKVLLKQWGNQPDILYVQVSQAAHVDAAGENVHMDFAPRISERCRDAVYDRITQDWSTDDILKGTL